MEVDMRGAENDEPEMSFRRGYQQGVIEVFDAIERFLDPTTRGVLQAWIEKDVFMWRGKAVVGDSPKLGVKMFCGSKTAGRGRPPEPKGAAAPGGFRGRDAGSRGVTKKYRVCD